MTGFTGSVQNAIMGKTENGITLLIAEQIKSLAVLFADSTIMMGNIIRLQGELLFYRE